MIRSTFQTVRTELFNRVIVLTVFLVIGLAANPANGALVGTMYLNSLSSNQTFQAVGNGTSTPTVSTVFDHGLSNQYGLAVDGTIKTTGQWSAVGREFSLTGVDIGPTSAPGFPIFDGTTDGTYNYSTDRDGKQLLRFNQDWSGGVVIKSGLPRPYTGITYDPTDDTMWMSSWNGQFIDNFDLNGNLLSSMDLASLIADDNRLVTLALDHSDGTLWVGQQTSNIQHQFTKTGTLLSTFTLSTSPHTAAWAAEFDLATSAVPLPPAFWIFTSGLLGLIGVARRKVRV